jgi:hypothetical protein
LNYRNAAVRVGCNWELDRLLGSTLDGGGTTKFHVTAMVSPARFLAGLNLHWRMAVSEFRSMHSSTGEAIRAFETTPDRSIRTVTIETRDEGAQYFVIGGTYSIT